MTIPDLATTAELARQLRVDSIRCSTEAGSGHPTSSLSAADLLAVLTARHLRYDWQQPKLPTNDHLIFSKGHASPLLYSLYRAVGVVSEDELIYEYRKFGSRLQGHPTPVLPWVDMATGSLGVGIAGAVGVALAGKALDRLDYRTYVLCGDSELTEGSVWEALDKASYYELDNLTVMVDVNRLGQRGPTEIGWDLERYAARVESFGCQAIMLDGHDIEEIDEAFTEAEATPGPVVLLARTIKGKGVPEIEDKPGWHGTALPRDLAERAIAGLGGPSSLIVSSLTPPAGTPAITPDPKAAVQLPTYELGSKVATRKAYGEALAAMSARPEVVVLDAEVGNSTHSEEFLKVAPDRYFETFIAEQAMVGVSMGLAARGYVPFAATFGAFISRAFDFIRMAGVSELQIRLCGSHAGVEIGADGPSQMALEDLASMRAVNDSVVLYPSDGPSAVALVKAMADAPGVAYLRTTRGAYPTIYGPDEEFPIGGAKVVRSSDDDQVSLLGAGVTLHESLAAAELLASEGISARVIDCYSVKPIDTATIQAAVAATGGRLVVTEDHYPSGGIGEAVTTALVAAGTAPKLVHLAVRGLSSSGTPAELLDAAGISAAHIADAARQLVS
ncbi:MAG: Transketolase protein [Acidimicrobiaceae bacterium]|nr:Transketolase protein [Acidimicrobiaceae bacterium]